MELTNGTIYQEWGHGGIDGAWLVKADTIKHNGKNIDWFYDSLTFEEEDYGEALDILEAGAAENICVSQMRDGSFNDQDKYAVFSSADTACLIAMLKGEVK